MLRVPPFDRTARRAGRLTRLKAGGGRHRAMADRGVTGTGHGESCAQLFEVGPAADSTTGIPAVDPEVRTRNCRRCRQCGGLDMERLPRKSAGAIGLEADSTTTA